LCRDQRSPDARRADHRHDPARARAQPHLGEPGRGLQELQSPQGRQDARGDALPVGALAVRAAQRPLLAVHAVPLRRAERDLAVVPVPRPELTPAMAPAGPGPDLAATIPPAVRTHIDTLRANGFAAYAVGGALRDAIRDVDAHDWDLASSAAPEQVQALFPGSVYENAFGTVALRVAGLPEPLQITTFRQDHDYADFRRPHRIVFGGTIEVDLARRDFTMNALAWGGPAGGGAGAGLVDPYDGRSDISARLIRAVGDPAARVRE